MAITARNNCNAALLLLAAAAATAIELVVVDELFRVAGGEGDIRFIARIGLGLTGRDNNDDAPVGVGAVNNDD